MEVTIISHNNIALQFIQKRIISNNYRGRHLSQHNRYDIEQIYNMLIIFNKYCPNGSEMFIRTTDISKRPENNDSEILYSSFCNDVKIKYGIGTQDAMRKNIFVDLARMGLIDRFNANKEKLDPYKKSPVKYVALSTLGLKFVCEKKLLNRYFIFSKAINQLLNGQIDIILDIMRDQSYNINYIDINEHMLIISAIDCELDDINIDVKTAVDLIKSYRALSLVQRNTLIDKLKSILQPSNYTGDKTKKRDFHNWRNESQQVYYLLKQTVYFDIMHNNTDKLVLKEGKISFNPNNTKLKRSQYEKNEYFKHHGIQKNLGFELHHVVPLSWSESVYHFKLLDTWKNMVYIDAYSHAKITQNRNRNVIMELDGDNIRLIDYDKKVVYLERLKNIDYNVIHKMLMQNYNSELLNITNS